MAIGTDTKAVGNGSAGSPADFNALFWTAVTGTGPYQPYPKVMDAMFSAAGTQLSHTAATTAYTASDSVSNSTTAASVTALSVTVSALNDQPGILDWINVKANDTAWAGKMMAVHVFNSDPTASSGVVAGDNVAWSNKMAGYLGRFEGTLRTFSDGAMGRLTPSEPGPFVFFPTSGAKTLFFQYQTLSDTGLVSASNITFDATFIGRQGQA